LNEVHPECCKPHGGYWPDSITPEIIEEMWVILEERLTPKPKTAEQEELDRLDALKGYGPAPQEGLPAPSLRSQLGVPEDPDGPVETMSTVI